MIIKVKPKKFPKLGTIRTKKKFVFFKRHLDRIFIFENVYLCQELSSCWGSNYDYEIYKAELGEPYNKVSGHIWPYWLHQGFLLTGAYWKTLNVMTKNEAFIEGICDS